MKYRSDEPHAFAIEAESIEIFPGEESLPSLNDLRTGPTGLAPKNGLPGDAQRWSRAYANFFLALASKQPKWREESWHLRRTR